MVERRDITAWITRSMPIVLVALLWMGLWKLWPEPAPYVWRPEPKPMKITLVSGAPVPAAAVDPTLFAFDSKSSYRLPGTNRLELLRMPEMPEGRPMFLKKSGQVFEARAGGVAAEYSAWTRKKERYSGEWDQVKLFNEAPKKKQLVVMMSADLKSAEYTFPVFEEGELTSAAAGWEVSVTVDIDKSGVPGHVLVEKGSGNKDIDALVCRKILLGSAKQPEEVKGGRVTVSYGSE